MITELLSITEMVFLFWVVPSLITFIGLVRYNNYLGLDPISKMDLKHWIIALALTIVYPVAICFIIGIHYEDNWDWRNLHDALTKERPWQEINDFLAECLTYILDLGLVLRKSAQEIVILIVLVLLVLALFVMVPTIWLSWSI